MLDSKNTNALIEKEEKIIYSNVEYFVQEYQNSINHESYHKELYFILLASGCLTYDKASLEEADFLKNVNALQLKKMALAQLYYHLFLNFDVFDKDSIFNFDAEVEWYKKYNESIIKYLILIDLINYKDIKKANRAIIIDTNKEADLIFDTVENIVNNSNTQNFFTEKLISKIWQKAQDFSEKQIIEYSDKKLNKCEFYNSFQKQLFLVQQR